MSEHHVRTYGNWRLPKSGGVWGMGFGASIGLFIGISLAVVAGFRGGFKAALLVAVITVVAVWIFAFKDIDHLSIADRAWERIAFMTRRKLFRSDLIGDSAKIPGVLSRLRFRSGEDSLGRPFVLVEPTRKTAAVVLGITPEGLVLHDSDHVDRLVAGWGQALASFGSEPGIDTVVVTIEASADQGHELRSIIKNSIDPNAPEFARKMLEEVADDYPRGAAIVRGWVTIVFQPREMGLRERDHKRILHEVGARLVSLTQRLVGTGAGQVHLVTEQELKRVIRSAFDPQLSDELNGASQLAFEDILPTTLTPEWDYLEHDECVSTSWTMTAAPRGAVQSNVLERFLGPMHGVISKRVSIFYKPVSAARTSTIVQRDFTQASARSTASGTFSARLQMETAAARQTAEEEAAGAGLEDFGVALTVTARRDVDLTDLKASLKALGGMARIRIRPAYGAQEGTFMANLPLGLRPWSDVAVTPRGTRR